MRLIFIAFLTVAAACTPKTGVAVQGPGPGDGESIEGMRAESLARIDRKACERRGGAVRQGGLMGLWSCVVPYQDAGKACRDGDDCEGRCLASAAPSDTPPGAAPGRCEDDDSPFGCYGVVEDGAVGAFMCVD